MKKMTSTCIIEVTENEIEILTQLATSLKTSPSQNPDLFCKESKHFSLQLPKRIRNILLNFAKNGSETGFLLIKGIPLSEDNIPKTPPGNNEKIGEQTLLARIQALFINVIGEMIAYEAEGYGRLFQDIVPVKSMSNIQTSLGSTKELEIHTEQAFSKLRPDILSLACLRGNKDAYTYILPVQSIINNINEECVKLLCQPLWKIGVDISFKLNGYNFMDGEIRGPISIISKDKDKEQDYKLVFDQDLMIGLNEESNKLIEKIVDIYYDHRIKHNLMPGEIILIDNNRAVHGRSRFIPKYDNYDRFLVRCFATLDYEKSDYARNARVVRAIYS